MATIALFGALAIVGLYLVNRAVPDVNKALSNTTIALEQEEVKKIGINNIGKQQTTEVKYVVPVTKDVEKIDPNTGITQKTQEITYEIKSEQRLESSGLYGHCVNDTNCEGEGIGKSIRCIQGVCAPLVPRRTIVSDVFGKSLFNPIELSVHKVCGKYYLGGDRSPCTINSQCSTSGVTCKVGDPDCISSYGDRFDGTYCDRDNKCSVYSNPDWVGIRWKWEDLNVAQRNSLGFPGKSDDNNRSIDILSQTQNCPELRYEMKSH